MNGKVVGEFYLGRGIYQGDPLSSYLFIVVANVLSRCLIKISEQGLLKGFRIEKSQV